MVGEGRRGWRQSRLLHDGRTRSSIYAARPRKQNLVHHAIMREQMAGTLASPDFNPEIEQMLRLDGANLILPPPTFIATYMERSTDPPD